jgi:adhesin/invasin
VLPGAGSNNAAVAVFATTPLSEITNFNSGPSSFLALANPNATTFYIIADSSTQTITSIGTTFGNPIAVANLANPATAAVMTPDGSLLAVAAGTLHLFNTTTNGEVVPGGLSQGTGINTFDVASSLDGTTLFALGSTSAGSSQLTAFATATNSASATLVLPQVATAIAVGPNGLVYLSLPNQVLELDPRTLQPTFGGTISVSGTPGQLIFTPDGQFAVAASQSLQQGSNLLVITLATHVATAYNLALPQITSLQTIGIDTILALANQGLYEITLSNPISVTQLQVTGLAASVHAIALSNEVPAGTVQTVQNIYAVAGADIYQINAANDNLVAQYPLGSAVSAAALSFVAPALTTTQSRPSLLLTYGTGQSILPSGTSEPLVVQVLDTNNHPLMGVPVQFQSSSNSATLSSTASTTGANGYAVTYLTAPATTGSISVTATAGGLIATFTINVSSSANGANAPHLTILAGQGQVMNSNSDTKLGPQYGSPLEVLVTDAQGNPMSGVPVTFTVTAAGGNIVTSTGTGTTETVTSNATGTAQVDFLTATLPSNNTSGFAQSLVTATSSITNSVNFYITTVNESPGASVYILSPVPGATLTGQEGSILPSAVSASVFSSAGYAIPNVSLILNDGNLNPTLYPTATCNTPNQVIPLTTTSGIVSCDVVFGPRVGTGSFTASVGYTHTSANINFQVTPGAPGAVQITQGNNQSGGPGQQLPKALVVHVTDSGGNTIIGASVNWQVLTAGAVTLTNVVSITDSSGNASALATLGAIGGTAQVKATSGTASATFSLTVNIPSAGLQKVSGDQQSTGINSAFTSPLIVKVVDANGNGVAGAQVNFQVASGVATLGSSSPITDSTGQASTTVTAGGTAGTITVSATTGSFSVSFTLTAHLPGPSNLTIVNGASFDPNTGISPGGIATIQGVGILPGVTGLVSAANSAGQLPTSFSGVTISFNGTAAPIYYVEDTNGLDQVTVQVPVEVQPGPAVNLTVSVANEGSASVPVPVKPIAPGVFTSSYGGKTYAVAVRPDGSQVSPTNPAKRGENIQLYVTGLGQATPAIATGAAGVPNQTVVTSMLIGLNNGGVPLISAVYGPGLIGIYVVTLQVPADTQTGPYQPVGVIAYDSAGNLYFAQPSYIPIQ